MRQDPRYRSVVLLGGAGCFLPSLIVFNLFFGWLFLRPAAWLLVEAVLVLLLLLYSRFLRSTSNRMREKRDKVIDTDAEIIE